VKPSIQKTNHQPITSEKLGNIPEIEHEPSGLQLISRLFRALAEEDITYCHWKSNNELD
jgi:hypothetical protein